MTDITLAGCEPLTLLSHMAVYGLSAILESEGVRDVRLGWTESGNPRPYVSAPEVDEVAIAARLRQHLQTLGTQGSWLQRDITLKGTPRGLMSPRLTPLGDQDTWSLVQRSRWEVLDALAAGHRWLDLRFLAALGEPCYWSFNRKGDSLQDDGASRFEMQPRNQGSEFVRNHLRKLPGVVGGRESGEILKGLRGLSEAGGGQGKPTTFSPAGLAMQGPADSVIAWCALWGISQFPIAMRVNSTAVTSGHISQRRTEWFYVPIWRGPWLPARLRSVLASEPLRTLATAGLELKGRTDADVAAARSWLGKRGVEGVVRFPIRKFGSDNAPERRAMRGERISVRGTA